MRAFIACFTADSAWLAIVSSMLFSPVSSCSKCDIPQISAETTRNIVLGALLGRAGEDFPRGPIFDQLAEIKESRMIRNPSRLLHIMGHDHNRIILLQFKDEILD